MAGDVKISPNVNYENASSACCPVFFCKLSKANYADFLDTVEMERAGDIHLSRRETRHGGEKILWENQTRSFPEKGEWNKK